MWHKKKLTKERRAAIERKGYTRMPKHDADGIERRRSKVTGEMQEFCRTPEAKSRRREEIYLAFKQRCGLCAKDLHPDRWEWHHVKHKSQGGDDSVANGMPLCKYPQSIEGGISCHELVHRPDLMEKAKAYGNPELLNGR